MHQRTLCARCGAALEATAVFCSACGFARTPSLTTEAPRRAALADPVLNALRTIALGEYDIGGRLGMGGMASVYLAHDLQLNRRVAIKAMLPNLLDNEGMIHRFFDEARKQARLEHPNIVPIYSLHWNEDLPFFAMKFVDGFPLDDVIHARGALPIPVVQHVLNGTISGLQYAHDEGVIHRDVKPGNVLIDRRGQLVVSDFGIAKAAESPHLTQTGAAIGTPTYMSPEQCRGLPLTPASDQYSVGVLAFQLLTGAPPFTGSMLDLLRAQVDDPPPSITARRPDCPPRLAAAVMRMLEKSPDARWSALRDALPHIVEGMGTETDARRQLVALFPDRPTAAESLPVTPRSPMPPSARPLKPAASPRRLIVTPSSGSWELDVGESVQMKARRSGGAGAGQSTGDVVWQTSDDAVVDITADGRVTAQRPGTVIIIATDGEITGHCEMTVVAANEQPSGQAPSISTASSAADAAMETVAADIANGATDIAPIQPDTSAVAAPTLLPLKWTPWRLAAIAGACLVAAVAVAFYATRDRAAPTTASPLVAKSDSAIAPSATTAAVVPAANPAADPVAPPAAPPIAAPTVARMALQLTRTALRVGDSARATARAFDSTGNRLTKAPITLASNAPKIVHVQSDGLVIALATGTATITARSGSIVKSENITVDQRLLPLSADEASAALASVLRLVSDEKWSEVQSILKRDVLDALRGKRGIDASLSGEPRIVSGVGEATVDFVVTVRWLNVARLGRSGTAPLRATFTRAGQGWRLTEIVARGKMP
jgi:eukaryotic-like serine/threonine-protein kinase